MLTSYDIYLFDRQRQFSTQLQDDCKEDSFDSLEELYLIRRSWSSVNDYIEAWLDESDCDSILIKLIICCFRHFPTSKSTMIYLILQFGAICLFLPHLKYLTSSLSTFFEVF